MCLVWEKQKYRQPNGAGRKQLLKNKTFVFIVNCRMAANYLIFPHIGQNLDGTYGSVPNGYNFYGTGPDYKIFCQVFSEKYAKTLMQGLTNFKQFKNNADGQLLGNII